MTTWYLDEYLPTLAPFLSEELIDQQDLQNIAAVAGRLPAKLSHQLLFECRLTGTRNPVDFQIQINKTTPGQSIIAGTDPAIQMPAHLRNDELWSRVRAFTALWADPNSNLARWIKHIWLEFDINEHTKSTPQPSLFFKVEPSASNHRHGWITTTALPILIGRKLDPLVVEQLNLLLQNLPQSDGFYLGAMLPRASTALVLVTRIKNQTQILPFLQEMGWSGSSRHLNKLLAELHRLDTVVYPAISFEEDITTVLGLECAVKQPFPDSRPWRKLLDFLVGNSWCTPEKAEALLAFPGDMNQQTHAELWPPPLLASPPLDPARYIGRIERRINHIKLTLKSKRKIEAKGYLAVDYYLEALK